MSHRGSTHHGPTFGPRHMFRGGYSSAWRGNRGVSSSAVRDDSDTKHLILELNPKDILPSGSSTDMSDFHCVASYNWLNSSTPTILVPGSPAIWSPAAYTRKLNPDKGEVFIDQNAARYPSFPLEPMFRAIYELHPDFDLKDFDVVIDRNTMNKLFEFIKANPRTFEIDVEIIGNKAVFVRKEKNATEYISEFRGFGFTFPEEYTRWDTEVKGSHSHHRIAQFQFAGLKYLLRFESDGYLPERTKVAKKTVVNPLEVNTSVDDPGNILSSGTSFSIGDKRPVAGDKIGVRHRGSEVDQGATIEIKTRAAHKPLDMEDVLPRLWMSQTMNLIAAYHRGGRFDNVQVQDVREDIEQWADRHTLDLQKLDAVMLRIIDAVKTTVSKRCRIKRAESGNLEIKELGNDHPGALPEDLASKLREASQDKDDRGQSDHSPRSDDNDGGGGYSFQDDEYESEGSENDYTACSSEDCGYCGHCRY